MEDEIEETPKNSVWPEEMVNDLRIEIAKGHSASQIAATLNWKYPNNPRKITRNSVVGKASRLDLSVGFGSHSKPKDGQPKEKPARPEAMPERGGAPVRTQPSKPTITVARAIPPKLAPLPAPVPILRKNGDKIGVMQLSNQTCKWPIGDPQDKDFHFCGHLPREGRPYCEYHSRMAYTTPEKQRSPHWVNPRHNHFNFTK